MKKVRRMKQVALLLVSIMLLSIFAGCGQSFDASAYIKALLDNSYKNDSTGFVDLKVGTAEEASELYEQGIDTEVQMMLSTAGVNISEEVQQEYYDVFKEIFSQVKYTVGEAEKQDDNSYVVSVSYQQMKIFEPTVTEYVAKITEMAEQYSADNMPSDDELYNILFKTLKDALSNTLENVEYGEEETTTIRVELKDRVYTPNETDLVNLEKVLFDTEAFQNAYQNMLQ